MDLTPVAVFAFNRPDAFRNTISALLRNPEAKDTDLYVFVDGPRNEKDAALVAKTREAASGVSGFRSVRHFFSEKNKGLAPSIIEGVSRILDGSRTVIVLEDDLLVQPGFLCFMNAGLNRYADDPRVFSVCGYTNRIRIPADYPFDAHCCPRSSSWGWATWRDRWERVDWAPSSEELRKNWIAFNHWGGSDCSKMLRDCQKGKHSSWAIRFCFAEFLAGGVSVFPNRSLVDNSAGFDGRGTHCRRYSRFRFDLDTSGKRTFSFPDSPRPDARIVRRSLWYHSLPLRAYSKLRYWIDGK